MTRDEALEKYRSVYKHSTDEKPIDVLAALGVLKLEDPKTATDRALDILNRHIARGGPTLTSHALCGLMDLANVRIVDKT